MSVDLTDRRPGLRAVINALRDKGIITRELADTFHTIRELGNEAVHTAVAQKGKALHGLKLVRAVAIWFRRLDDPGFKPGAFVPPPTPTDTYEELRAELDELRERLGEESKARAPAATAAEMSCT
ncbi:hypothetical protein BH23VER1_BH23VER1_13450 [soil metagenome]